MYKRFDVEYKSEISRPKYLFLWCLFLTKKWVENGVYRNEGFFYYGIDMKYARLLHFILLLMKKISTFENSELLEKQMEQNLNKKLQI